MSQRPLSIPEHAEEYIFESQSFWVWEYRDHVYWYGASKTGDAPTWAECRQQAKDWIRYGS